MRAAQIMSFNEATSLLVEFPGSLIYHFTLAFCFALLFSLTQVYPDRSSQQSTRTWLIAAGGLLILRLLNMIVAGLTWQAILDARILLPPLDRFVSLASMTIIMWAVLQDRPTRRRDSITLAIMIALSLGLIVTVLSWMVTDPSISFNRTSADAIWGAVGTLGAATAMVLLWKNRPREMGLAILGAAFLLLGYALHFSLGAKDQSLAGPVRLAELSAYPLFTILAARRLAEQQKMEPVAPPLTLASSVDEPSSRTAILREVAGLVSISSTQEMAAVVTHAVATLLKAELALLLTPPDSTGRFSIANGYDLIQETSIPGGALDREGCPVLATALERQRSVNLPSSSHSPDLQALRKALNIDQTGPALLVPMVAEDELLGGLLLLSPYARRRWSQADRATLEQVAHHIGRRFSELRTNERVAARAPEASLGEALQQVEKLERENARLLDQLQAARSGEQSIEAENLVALLQMHEESQETIDALEQEIERLRASPAPQSEAPPSEEIEHLTRELTRTMMELSDTRSRLASVESMQEGPRYREDATDADIDAIASIAQEIRQPMSSIQGYTDLLLGESVGLLGAMQKNFLERVRTGIDRMDQLVDNLLQVTTIERGALDLTPSPIDLLRCIEEAVIQVRTTMKEKDLALRMDFPDELPAIMGDEDALIQILFHVLNNAAGASPQSEEIILAARVQQGEEAEFLMLTISDAGEGVPPEDLGRVFERMRETDTVSIPGLGDSGVGLSIVHALSDALGGRVWFDSEVGVGSTVTVLLPLADPNAPLLRRPV
jgi:signal transduction histidine kinase